MAFYKETTQQMNICRFFKTFSNVLRLQLVKQCCPIIIEVFKCILFFFVKLSGYEIIQVNQTVKRARVFWQHWCQTMVVTIVTIVQGWTMVTLGRWCDDGNRHHHRPRSPSSTLWRWWRIYLSIYLSLAKGGRWWRCWRWWRWWRW